MAKKKWYVVEHSIIGGKRITTHESHVKAVAYSKKIHKGMPKWDIGISYIQKGSGKIFG